MYYLMEIHYDVHPFVMSVCKVQVDPFVNKGTVNSNQQTFRAHWTRSVRVFLISSMG
jgi:hypothetical protein